MLRDNEVELLQKMSRFHSGDCLGSEETVIAERLAKRGLALSHKYHDDDDPIWFITFDGALLLQKVKG